MAALFSAAPKPMAVLDGEGRLVDVNRAWEEPDAEPCRFGASEPGASYVEAAEAWDGPHGQAVAAGLRDLVAGTRDRLELEYVVGDRWLALDAYAVDEAGTRRILVVHTDVTHRRSEARDLAASRLEQEALFDQASDGIVISDTTDGRILKANTRAAELFGYPLDEFLELSIADLLTKDELDRDPPDLAAIRAGKRVVREREGRRSDGTGISIEISATQLTDGRLLGMVRDITARKRRAAALKRQATELAERVKEQRAVYGISRLLQGAEDLNAALAEVVTLIPTGWQLPGLAEARVVLDGVEHATPGFRLTPWRIARDVVVDGTVRGLVEVAYRERPSPEGQAGQPLAVPSESLDGVFLVEEDALLEEITARLAESVRRRQAEERLRRSEAHFRTLTEKAVDMVAVTAGDGTVRYLSPSFQEALGPASEGGVGRSVLELVHPADEARLREGLTAALRDPSHQPTVEFRIQDGAGRWRVLESTSRNLLEDPAVEGVVIEARDVTARREAEERIHFQARLLDSVGQAVVATDAAGRVIYWNRAAETVYGWSREDVLGQPTLEVLPVVEEHPGSRALLEAVTRRERWAGEILARRRDGGLIPLLVADEPIPGEDGEFAGYVAVASDLTELKAAERAVRESEERLRSLAENASDLTLVLDAEGRVTYASPNYRRILGERAEATIGRAFDPVSEVHPDDQERAEALWAEVRSRPGDTLAGELRVRHADGSWRLLELYLRNLLDNPAVSGVVVNARDATERAHLEQQLQQAQKMEAVGRLAGGVAHDFNNLLTGVKGYTQLALESLEPDHPVRADLREVERAAERAARLTQQLLAFSRRQVMQPRVMDPNLTVRDLQGMLGRLIGEDVRLVTELDPEAGHVHVDPGQLEQVIVNLVVNARDAMPTGGRLGIRTRRVRLEARDLAVDGEGLAPGDYVEVAVSDTGAGMSAETLERVFEPFFTTKKMGEGTGLGLSTVYGIVKQSGGLIRVESAPGDGTTFRVLFPDVEAPTDPSDDAGPRPATHGPEGGETLLLVEDDDAVRRLASRVLRGRGYRVLTARNGAEGLRRFEQARRDGDLIDMVLSDVVMPELGGREMVEMIREAHPTLPVILMSGYTDDVLLRHGVDNAGAEFLEKPFTPTALIGRVRAVLDGARVIARGSLPPGA